MSDTANLEPGPMGVRLVDDAYLAWLCAEAESEIALRSWAEASGSARARAYAAYRATLDREEAAALDLERLACLSELCRLRSVLGAATPCD